MSYQKRFWKFKYSAAMNEYPQKIMIFNRNAFANKLKKP